MANNRIPSGPNTPGSQQTPSQGIKVFIQRDYSEGTAVKFQTRFPAELEDRVSDLLCKSYHSYVTSAHKYLHPVGIEKILK